MKKMLMATLTLITALIVMVACQPVIKTKTTNNNINKSKLPNPPLPRYFDCKNPRPELCTQQYDPVCANRDTGIRCVKVPCPSSKQKTYGNACTACSDKKVMGYVKGACKK